MMYLDDSREPTVRYDIIGNTGTIYVGDGCVTDTIYIGLVIVPFKCNEELCFEVKW